MYNVFLNSLFLGTCYILSIFLQVLGLLWVFFLFFSVPYFGLVCDHGNSFFFVLKSKKEKVLDRGQNGF